MRVSDRSFTWSAMRKDSLSSIGGGPLVPPTLRQSMGRDPSQNFSGSRGKSSGSSSCPSPSHKYQQWEVKTLRAELEAERLRFKEAEHRFSVEAQKQCEATKRDQQLLVNKLNSKWEQRWACKLHQLKEATEKQRKAEIGQLLRWKEAELCEAQKLLQGERDAAMQQAREMQHQLAKVLVSTQRRRSGSGGELSAECWAKLQQVLSKRQWEVESDQAVQIRHLQGELELERSLFLKYILERSEGESLLAGSSNSLKQAASPQLLGRARPPSMESPTADVTPDVWKASKSCSPLDASNKLTEASSHQQLGRAGSDSMENHITNVTLAALVVSKACSLVVGSCHRLGQRSSREHLGKAGPRSTDLPPLVPPVSKTCVLGNHLTRHESRCHYQLVEEGSPKDSSGPEQPRKELQMKKESKKEVSWDSLPEGKGSSWGAAGEHAQGSLPQQSHSLLAVVGSKAKMHSPRGTDNCNQQNTEPLNDLKVLEERCTHLEKENELLRKNSFPGIQHQAKLLKRRSAQLAVITKQVEEVVKKLHEAALRVSRTRGPLLLNCSETEAYKKALAQQQAKELNKPALQEECQELQEDLSSRKENDLLLKISDFDRLLQESLREVLQLQRQLALMSQRASLHSSQTASIGSSSSVLRQEALSTISECLEDSSLASEKQKN